MLVRQGFTSPAVNDDIFLSVFTPSMAFVFGCVIVVCKGALRDIAVKFNDVNSPETNHLI